MNYRERALFHADKAVEAAAQVAEYQAAALRKAKQQQAHKATPDLIKAQDPEYLASTILKDYWPYRVAVDNRNGHQIAAQTYALVALLQATPDMTTWNPLITTKMERPK